jgi:hypothetical protein
MDGFERGGFEFSQLSRMSNNLKAAAKEVHAICKNPSVKNGLQKLAASNTSANRGTQWSQVGEQFRTNCNVAQRIVLTPNPNSQLLSKIDPAYTKNVAERVLSNVAELPALGGKRRRRNKTNRKNRNRKTRRNRN